MKWQSGSYSSLPSVPDCGGSYDILFREIAADGSVAIYTELLLSFATDILGSKSTTVYK